MDIIYFDKVINRSHTQCEKWDGCQDVFGTSDILPMWVADMDFASPLKVIEEIEKRAHHGVYGYALRGNSLYEAICLWYQKRHLWSIDRSWISFSPGVVPALSACVQAYTDPGDSIIIFTPVYTPFFKIISKNGRTPLVSPLKEESPGYYTIDFDQLEESILSRKDQVRMMILCSPHNPIGRVWTKEELMRLGEICLKNNIIIISDDIHHDLVYAPHKHIPIASLSQELEQLTITCTAPSKTFNIAGLTSSFVVIPNTLLRHKFQDVMEQRSLGEGNLFGIAAMESAYRYGEDWLENLVIYLGQNIEKIESFLSHELKDEGIVMIRPEASYLAWLDFRLFQQKYGMTHQQLCDFLVQKAKIGLSNGLIYSSQEGFEGKGFMRMNFGCPKKTLEEGLSRLREAIIYL